MRWRPMAPRDAPRSASSRILFIVLLRGYDRRSRASVSGDLRRGKSLMLHTSTNSGLHDFVGEHVLVRYARPGVRAADLGAGPGAMAARLRSLGCDVVAVDRDSTGFEAQVPHVSLD